MALKYSENKMVLFILLKPCAFLPVVMTRSKLFDIRSCLKSLWFRSVKLNLILGLIL